MRKNTQLFCLAILFQVFLIFSLTGCSSGKADSSVKKVMVIGFDGMDPQLLSQYMAEGRLPNFAKLAESGDFKELGTSNPPQSPVAWSNFITGMNPGGHGIYDFIHRDPKTMLPKSSTTESIGANKTIKVGKWILPISGGEVKNLRQGRAFWNYLEDQDVPTTVFRVPANYPPVESKGSALSGMGTPDLAGTFGTFSFYTDDPPPNRNDIAGGVVYPVRLSNNTFESKLVGPQNTFLEKEPEATTPFTVWVDPEYNTAKIEIQDVKIVLQEKEWSDWLQVSFELIPGLQSVSGICRFYLKEVRPNFKLYVTPINIDPADPALPISTPEDYAMELHQHCGNFYTQGMPEDTKALSWDVFDYDDFLSQSDNVLQERLLLFDYVLNSFEEGLLFFYFSSTDLNAHMLYNMIDPDHPTYEIEQSGKYAEVIPTIYESADTVVGQVMERIDGNTTLIVMSDHGFAPFRRAVHLNTVLKNENYMTLIDESRQAESQFLLNVDWTKTQAYALGFNALYLNLENREMRGIVKPEEKEMLLQEITEKLLALRDPENGLPVIHRVYRAEEIYSGAELENAPDLVVGYSRGYRASNETTTGSLPKAWIGDNLDRWSGDHCMAAELVPGIILSNKKLDAASPKLYDLAPTILSEFGIPKPGVMVGKPIFNNNLL